MARRAAVGLVALLLAATAVAPVGADEASDARRQREEARRRRAEAAAQLDTLRADNAELERAVRDLGVQVRAQEAQVGDARRAREAAEGDVAAARRRLEAAKLEVLALETRVRERAVAAYVNPAGTEITTILASGDLTEAARKGAFIRQVARADRTLLDRFRAAREARADQEATAEAAAARAARQQADEEAALASLEQTRAAQSRLQQALETRIAEFQAEVDALAAQEAELTDIIRRHEEEQRRAREEAERRARVAEEAGRRARARAEAEAEAAARAQQEQEQQQRERDRQEAPAQQSPPAREEREPQSQAPSSSGLIWPVRGPVTSEFGMRWGRMHQGIDIGAGTGTPIRASASGTVIYAGWMNGYGNVVLVDHGGLTTVYAHQSRIASSEGQSVGQGEVIGYVGSTGRSTGPHLHFETRVAGAARNPRSYLP